MKAGAESSVANELNGTWLRFEEFDLDLLYDLLRLRQEVFIVEQNCAFEEIDGKDRIALHYLLRNTQNGAIAGGIRIFLPSDQRPFSRIGRVVVAKSHRGTGLGKNLMRAGIEKCLELASGSPIHLSAQAHLERFYGELGFLRASEEYLEDGIPHLDMVRAA